jgi:3-hydroxyisobutyrate dehydrogenase
MESAGTTATSNANDKPRIGYVGIGLMGLPMTRRLLERGYTVSVFDINPERTELARTAGARVAVNPADAVHEADLVLLNLPTTDAVELAVFGDDGVASAIKPPQLLVDFSTVKVEKGRALAAKLRQKTGCGWVDAPVSGGPPACAAGTLTVMAGGEPADLERIRLLMADIAGQYTPMGPSGAGSTAKMINQLIVGCGHAVMAEAVVLAEAAGIDAARIPECLAGGYADSSMLQKLYPRIVERDFAPQGYARQIYKLYEPVGKH